MVKKAIELTQMLDMEMLIIFKDLDTGKLSQYTSGDAVKGFFTIDKAIEDLKAFRAKGKVVKTFDDGDY